MVSAEKKIYSIDELKEIVAPVAERYGVAKLYLFGSVTRGDCDEYSDYDFCIETGRMRGLIPFSGFFQDLSCAVGRRIDLVDIRALDPEFLEAVMSEGIVVYEG